MVEKSESGQKKNKIFFERYQREIFGPFLFSEEKPRRCVKCLSSMPKFTESKIDRAYESFVKQVPGSGAKLRTTSVPMKSTSPP